MMFYCEPCRIKNEWPEGWAKSRGPCEVCGQVALCYDVQSRRLTTPADTRNGLHRAVARVVSAYVVEGTHPPTHRAEVERLRREWPTLAVALDDLVAELKRMGAPIT
jgi:hypothetical protein